MGMGQIWGTWGGGRVGREPEGLSKGGWLPGFQKKKKKSKSPLKGKSGALGM